MLGHKPIVDELLSNTAWETAKSTDIIQEFDYHTVQVLTEAYSMQELIMEKTLLKVVDLYFDRRTQRTENMDETLIQMRLTTRELYGQESLLLDLYSAALKTLQES